MDPINVKRHVRSRRATLSAEARFVMKNLIKDVIEEEEGLPQDCELRGIEPGDVALATLAWLPSYSWLAGRLNRAGISRDSLLAVRGLVPVSPVQSTRSMLRMFTILDRISAAGERVSVEDLLYASLMADSEFLGTFISKVLHSQECVRFVSVESILRDLHAPEWMIEESIEAHGPSIDLEYQQLLAYA